MPMQLGMILGAIGVLGFGVFAVVGLVREVGGAARQRRGTTTTGTVLSVEVRERATSEGPNWVLRTPTVEFTDATGQRRTFRNAEPTECPEPGGTITVWYDPDRPSTRPEVLRTASRHNIVGYSIAVAAFGVMVLAVASMWPLVISLLR